MTNMDDLKNMLENASVEYIERDSDSQFYIDIMSKKVEFIFDETGNLVDIDVYQE